MPIDMIVTDLDDTLLRSDATISPYTEATLKRAMSLGVKLVLASGRMTSAMTPYAAQLGITMPLIAYNGAQISDPVTGEVLDSIAIEPSLAQDVCRQAEGLGLHIQAYMGSEYYYPQENTYSMGYAAAINVTGNETGVPMSVYVDKPVIKLLIIDEPARISEMLPLFQRAYGHILSCTMSRSNYIEFTHILATKGNALSRLTQSMGIDRNEILAFGDGQNDLSMLKFAGIGYASGNARAQIKAQVSHVAPSNEEDGVAWVVEEMMKQGQIGGR